MHPFFAQVNHNRANDDHTKMRSQSEPNCSLRNYAYSPLSDNANRKIVGSVPENMFHRTVTPKTMPDNATSTCQSEHSRKDIESKLEAMENYLDGFYTKAKSDVRNIRKLIQDDEKMESRD